jgi:hypothetical protein
MKGMKRKTVLLIVLLAVIAFIAVDIYLHVSEKDAPDSAKTAFVNTADSTGPGDGILDSNEVNTDTSTGETAIDIKLLIQNLDKVTDETIGYVYNNSPDNITVGNIYEGDFTGSGKPELLVIFKLLKMPHAGGLDCSVAAVYDRSTLGIITQKTFQYDECHFNILKDDEQKSYLLFTGSTTYQGYSQYTLGLWKPGKTWTDLYQPVQPYDSNKMFDLRENGSIWVSRPVFEDPESHETTWLHEYNLVWNKKTHTLDESIPTKYKDENGNPNVDAISVSPDGKYAVSTHLDKYSVLLYDVINNSLADNMEMPALDYGFMWSPDSSKLCVTRAAREWIESSIVDIASKKVIELSSLVNAFKEEGVKLAYTLNENRPDPYVTPIEWSPDSSRILLFYQWTDSDQNRQNGTFVFEPASGKISEIKQNKASQEGGNMPAVKPGGFKW